MTRALPLLTAALLVAAACSDAPLYGDAERIPPDEVVLQGQVCTADPADLAFPVKVLFLVDVSISDGEYVAQRGGSVERVVRSFAGANYSYAVIRYGGARRFTGGGGAAPCSLQNLTPDGFTKSLEDALLGIQCIDNTQSGRDVMSALSLANAFISGDVLQTELGRRSRTKYVVVMLGNGPPTVSLQGQWCNSRSPPIAQDRCAARYFDAFCDGMVPPPESCENAQYVEWVRGMRAFAEESGVQQFFFHVVYQRDPDRAVMQPSEDDPTAVALYSEMAVAGGGNLYRFPGPALCDDQSGGAGCIFSDIDLDSTAAIFLRRHLIVSNRNALATRDGIVPDSDGDGLSDAEEQERGLDPTLADTDGDLLTDRVEVLLEASGLSPFRNEQTDPDGEWPVECPLPGSGSPNAFPPEQDRDGDRLSDCEENLLRSEKSLYDSDADGVPDALELKYGTNLLTSDPLEDADADGFANVDEYLGHLDPLARERSRDKLYRYRYENEGVKTVLAFTQPFAVTGVYVTATSAASHPGRGAILYEPPADPSRPAGPGNPAYLSWKDPQDITPTDAEPGRGPRVAVTQDGPLVLHSAASVPGDPEAELSIDVDVYVVMLPTEPSRDDVRLRAGDRFCFDFRVKNVKLVQTLALPDGTPRQRNYLDVFLSEVPENDPTAYGIFRVATIPVDYNPGGLRGREIELTDQDFLLFAD